MDKPVNQCILVVILLYTLGALAFVATENLTFVGLVVLSVFLLLFKIIACNKLKGLEIDNIYCIEKSSEAVIRTFILLMFTSYIITTKDIFVVDLLNTIKSYTIK